MHQNVVYMNVRIRCRPVFIKDKVPDKIYRTLQHGDIYIYYNHLLPQYFDTLTDLLDACEEHHDFDEHKKIVLDMSIECVPSSSNSTSIQMSVLQNGITYCFLPTRFMQSCARQERRVSSLMHIITVSHFVSFQRLLSSEPLFKSLPR